MKRRKELIDLNPEIASKRLNLEIGYRKETKKENLQKLEAKDIEERGLKKLNEKENIFKLSKKSYDDLTQEINNLYRKLNETKISLDLLDKGEDPNTKNMNNDKGENSKENQKEMFDRLTKLAVANEERERLKKEYKNNIKEYSLEIEKLQAKIPDFFKEMELKRKEVDETRNNLSEYYHLLLYEGLDFRGEGLISIIKNIWNAGLNVNISFMPSYLDNDAIDYLFTRAKQSLQISKIKKELAEAKLIIGKKYKESINSHNKQEVFAFKKDGVNRRDSKEIIFKTELETIPEKPGDKKRSLSTDKVSDKFMKIYQKKIDFETEEITLKTIKNKLNNRSRLNTEIMDNYNKLKGMEALIKELEERMNEMKQKEITRISKEFIYNNYQEKYKANIETVLSALCGNEGRNSQLLKYAKYEKSHNENLKKIKFYSTYFNEKCVQKTNKSANFGE